MPDLNDLLLKLFEKLRRTGIPLGVSDYLDTITAIQAGLGLESKDKFKQLLRLLWAKSHEDQKLFEELFDNQFDDFFSNIKKVEEEAEKEEKAEDQQQPPQTPPIGIRRAGNTQNKHNKPLPPLPVPPKPTKTPPNRTVATQHYQLTPLFPINQRDMAGMWRQLRRPQRTGVPEELDVDATIHSFALSGSLIYPVLRPRCRNLSRLVVLVDRQGSMTPFHPWIDAMIESIIRGGLLGRVSFYYFHDCPEIFVYCQPDLTGIVKLETVLDEQVRGSSVLIISDAGAARGYFDSMLVSNIKAFLQKLRSYTYLYAWINPMPKNRWIATTAEDVACLVPMFSLDREGLNDAINILRGQPFPVGVDLNDPNQ